MTTEIEKEIAQPVRVMQILCLALAIGPVVFAGVIIFGGMRHDGDPEPGILSLVGLVLASTALTISPILRKIAADPAKIPDGFHGSESARLAAAYRIGLIVASALNEAAAFLNLIAFMIEGSPWSLALAALMVVVNVMKFPTVGGVAAWIESRQRLQRDEAQLMS